MEIKMWPELDKLIADNKVRDELRTKLEDVQDAYKTACDDTANLRYAEKEAMRSRGRHSEYLNDLFAFITANNLNLTDLGVELGTLWGL